MVAAVEDNLGQRPVQVLGDAGYYSAENNAFCEDHGIDGLLSVGREKHVLDPSTAAASAKDSRADMRARLHTAIGKGAYSRRKCIVEPVFGQIKDARGIRSFLLRGLEQVRGEWNLVCLTHHPRETITTTTTSTTPQNATATTDTENSRSAGPGRSVIALRATRS